MTSRPDSRNDTSGLRAGTATGCTHRARTGVGTTVRVTCVNDDQSVVGSVVGRKVHLGDAGKAITIVEDEIEWGLVTTNREGWRDDVARVATPFSGVFTEMVRRMM